MWQQFWGYIPSGAVWICAILSTAIPMLVYFINQKLHKYGDPPWKKDAKSESKIPEKS